MTTPIILTIPIETQVIRANPALKVEALAIAEKLHAMIAAMRPHPQPDRAFEPQDAIDAVRRTILGFWPTGKTAAANEGMWVIEQPTCGSDGLHNNFSLYDRYLRLCERVSGVSIAAQATTGEEDERRDRMAFANGTKIVALYDDNGRLSGAY